MPGLMGLDEMLGVFNGTVSIDGERTEVRNSMAIYRGQPLLFSADGKVVLNQMKQPVAEVKGGKVVPLKR